jgi:catecholate siderophore receptor
MKHLLSGASLLAIASLSVSPSLADGHDDPATDEVVVEGKVLYSDRVNALKTPTPIVDVPQSAQITTGAEIFDRGFNSIGDIVRYTPGVNTSQGEGHRDAVVIRGIRSTADFFVDGVRDDVQYYRSLYNLDQVEVLRGPNSLLFGRGGTGGLINRVTKKASIGEEFGSFGVDGGSFSQSYGSFDYNFNLGPNSALRFNAHADKLGGDRDFMDGDRFGFNPTLRVKLSPRTTMDLSYENVDHERFIDRGIPTGDNGLPKESLSDVVFGMKSTNFHTVEADIIRASFESELSDTLKSNFVLSHTQFDKVYQNLYANDYSQADNEVRLKGYLDPTGRDSLIASYSLIKDFGNHTLLVGAEYVDQENTNHRYKSNFVGDAFSSNQEQAWFNISSSGIFNSGSKCNTSDVSVDENGAANCSAADKVKAQTSVEFTSVLKSKTETEIEVNSIYFQDQWDISDNLIVTLGGRYDDFDITLVDVQGGVTRTATIEEFGPRGGIVFKPNSNSSLYASYSESFLPRSGEQFKAMSDSASITDPDEFENSEIGYKYDDGNTVFSLAYFELESTRFERANLASDQTEERDMDVDGYEIAYSGKLSDSLSLAATYSEIDGKNGSADAREIPEQTWTLWMDYQASPRLSYGLGVTHQGESLIADGSTRKLPDYERIDFSLNYDVRDDLTLQFFIENLADEDYYPHSHGSHQVTVGEPVNAKLGFYKKF